MSKKCEYCGDFDNGHSQAHCIEYLRIRLGMALEKVDELGDRIKTNVDFSTMAEEVLRLRNSIAQKDELIQAQAKNLRELRQVNESQKRQIMMIRNRGGLTRDEKVALIMKLKDIVEDGKKLSHARIAERVGCSREYVSRVLSPHSTMDSTQLS